MAERSLVVEFLPDTPQNYRNPDRPEDPTQRPPGDYSLGEPAESVYNQLNMNRQAVIDTARLMAELTIPSLVPPDGWKTGDQICANNQSLGSRCVNNLAANLVFMAFPPNQPVMKLEAIEYEVQEQVNQDPELWAKMEIALGRLAEAHRKRLMSDTTLLSAYTHAMKLLIVAGNCLWKHNKLSSPTVYDPCHYAVKRNATGDPLLVIHKECLSLQTLSPDFRDQIYQGQPELRRQPQWEQEAEIYTVCKLDRAEGDEPVWHYWQEHKGTLLEGTEVETDFDDAPMVPLWMIPVYGQDWGRSYCEEYRGDLFCAEALSSATMDAASLAALSLLFVNPSGRTSLKQVREARNLSTFAGKAEDLSVFRSEKGADMAFVMKKGEEVDHRLGMAFLLNFAIQRNGERVTAEEIRRLGSELDKALGGLYSELAQKTTRPVVLRFMHLNEEENPKLPKLPKGIVQVQVITGMDALGDSKEVQDLEDLAAAVSKFFPKDAADILNSIGWSMRYAAAKGIKPDGVVNSPEAVKANRAQQAQDAMKQTLLEKGTTPAVSGLAQGLNTSYQAAQGQPPAGAQ